MHQTNSGLGCLFYCLSIFLSRMYARTHTSRLLWKSDQTVAEAATTTKPKHKRRRSMPSVVLEPAFPAIKQLETSVLDGAATVFYTVLYNMLYIICCSYSRKHAVNTYCGTNWSVLQNFRRKLYRIRGERKNCPSIQAHLMQFFREVQLYLQVFLNARLYLHGTERSLMGVGNGSCRVSALRTGY
jgi:hypothetical protein